MSLETEKLSEAESTTSTSDVTCGIIMPISATANFSETHWVTVRILIERAIIAAGYSPAPVWENSTVDRVSERIIGNIFRFPLMVVDISDNNPNVMFELGLRLCSKMPTVVVADEASRIPFDIGDFHVVQYPTSLSIIETERFLENLSNTLKAKMEAAQSDDYTPFLNNVIVDVVAPGRREVPFENFILERLDEIDAKISRQLRPVGGYKQRAGGEVISTTGKDGSKFYFSAAMGSMDSISNRFASSYPAAKLVGLSQEDGISYYALVMPELKSNDTATKVAQQLLNVVAEFGGVMGIPNRIANKLP